MLWYKSWLDTRWRFLIGFGLLVLLAVGTVVGYPAAAGLLPLADAIDGRGPLGRAIREAVELQREYRGFVWYQWVRQNLSQTVTLFAILLGSGGLLAHASGGAVRFTMSLPVSRNQVLRTRALTGLAELLVLAMVPFLLIPVLSPAIGESYGMRDVFVYGICVFVATSTFFSLAFFLSTMFADLWRPLLIACALAMVVALAEQVLAGVWRHGVFSTMTSWTYMREGDVPWAGLFTSATVSAALLYGAATNFARQDL